MRPVALHLEGFGPFREPCTVDFEGTDYFALVGPTGSGKSTVIDAICFALYGSVPRYHDEGAVAPAVSLGGQEATVSLTFDVGADRYRATRVVRVRNGKASTAEALLERIAADGTEVLAGSARAMKPAVERLLGLPFAHFTKCVVLPQGEFARFLHDDPRKRRELLERLLDLQVYERVGQLARQAAADAKNSVTRHDEQLAALTDATEKAHEAAGRRVEALRAFHRDIEAAGPEDAEFTAAIETATTKLGSATALAAQLTGTRVPKAVGSVVADEQAATLAIEATVTDVQAAVAAVAAAEANAAALPPSSELARAHDAHLTLARLHHELDGAQQAQREAIETLDRAGAALTTAGEQLEVATNELAAARIAHAAHDLATHLEAGAPCPVCEQEVTRVPKRKRPAALAKAEAAVSRAQKQADTAQVVHQKASRAQVAAETRVEQLTRQCVEPTAAVGDHPDLERVVAALEAHAAAVDRLGAARASEAAARRAEHEARTRAEQLAKRVADARAAYGELRDGFLRAELSPPPPTDDLGADWARLTEWATTEATTQREAVAAAEAEIERARAARTELLDRLHTEARALGLTKRTGTLAELRDDVVEVGTHARGERQRIGEAIELAGKLREQTDAARAEQLVAQLLGDLMKSDRFRQWLLAEALEVLVVAASRTLRELSGGQYSLHAHDDEFLVVDHTNADEMRSARTLSGGETFQAALALALALSEQISTLAAAGSSKLDAIFLDEGFGTLDADTLETVASTIEALAATGRMVGLVTHVPALAERVPVRFRVTRAGRNAEVTREDA